MKKIKLLTSVIVFIALALVGCNENKITDKDLEFNSSTLEEFPKIKNLNGLILENIETICDSTCHHNKSCNYDLETRKTIFVPINKNLAKKYISSSEPQIEKLINDLSPSSIQSNEDPIRGNIIIRLDSTIIYNCYHRMYSDTVIVHQLIYHFKPKEREGVETLTKKLLEPNWTYRIIKYYDPW